MKVVIEVINHSEQRYNTVGDWWWEDLGNCLQLRISNMGDWRANMSVAYHELFEALACKQSGISQESVDAFDKCWEPYGIYEEPGDDPKAPYYKEHQMALAAEQVLLSALGLGLAEYMQMLGKFEKEDKPVVEVEDFK